MLDIFSAFSYHSMEYLPFFSNRRTFNQSVDQVPEGKSIHFSTLQFSLQHREMLFCMTIDNLSFQKQYGKLGSTKKNSQSSKNQFGKDLLFYDIKSI